MYLRKSYVTLNGEDCADNPNMQCDSASAMDNGEPESGDNIKTAPESAVYDFVEKVLNHLGKSSYLTAFIKHGVYDHVILSSSCEDLPIKLKALRLSDQVIKEITVFMDGFHLAISSDAGNQVTSKLSPVLTDKSDKSQPSELPNVTIGSYYNLVEHCDPTDPHFNEGLTDPNTRRPIHLRQRLCDPCTVACNDAKSCELHSSCCRVHQSHSIPDANNSRRDFHSQVPDSLLSSNPAPSSKEQCHHGVKKDATPSVSFRFQGKNSSEIDVSFIQKMRKRLEEDDKWKKFLSSYASEQKFRLSS